MGEVLSQAEIDALLAALDSGEIDPGEMKKEAVAQKVKVYDFKRPEKFTKEQMRTLQMLHENFARALSTYLATTLRTMVEVKVLSVQQLSYYEFTRSLPIMTVLAVYNIPTWEGRGLLECNPGLIFTMIDRMLGGPGTPPDRTRPLTDIEQGLVQQLMRQVGDLYRDAWRTVADVHFDLDSLETNPLFTQIVSQNETVALVTCSARIGTAEGMMNICLPHLVLEQVMDKLTTRTWYAGQTQPTDGGNVSRLKQRVNQVQIPLQVELGKSTLSLGDLIGLQVGDCIQLETKANGLARVLVGPFPKFMGTVGLSRNRLAVMIDSVIEGGEDDG